MVIHQQVAALREQLQRFSGNDNHPPKGAVASSCAEIDRLLGGGCQPGQLVEWLAEGSLARTASLLMARRWVSRQRPAILIDPARRIFPPALAAAGFDLQAMVIVQPGSARDLLWSWEQALSCQAASLVWGEVAAISPIAYRRLKLAAEKSGVIGFLLRATSMLSRPTWADLRLLVEPQPSTGDSPRFALKVYATSGVKGGGVVMEFSPEQSPSGEPAGQRSLPFHRE